jgi:hypothetical protein
VNKPCGCRTDRFQVWRITIPRGMYDWITFTSLGSSQQILVMHIIFRTPSCLARRVGRWPLDVGVIDLSRLAL